MSRRLEPIFFGKPWINKVIDFTSSYVSYPTKQWQIVRKLNELCLQEDEQSWITYEYDPMESIAVFECVNPLNNNESAIMKIYMQVPYAGSEYDSAADRAQQAAPGTSIMELTALIALTKNNCQSAPKLLDWMRLTQDETGVVPNGYIMYMVTKKLPGTILSRAKFWDLSREERDIIRKAFKTSYQDCLESGAVQIRGVLGSNVLWDPATKKIYILGWRNSSLVDETIAWEGNTWLAWGFIKRNDISSTDPTPPDNLEDFARNEDLWVL